MLKKLILIFSVLFSNFTYAELCYECHFRYLINKSKIPINVYSNDGQLKFIEGINIYPDSGFLYSSFSNSEETTCLLITHIINGKEDQKEYYFYIKSTPEIEEKLKNSQLAEYYLIYDGNTITVWDKPSNGNRLNFDITRSCPIGVII